MGPSSTPAKARRSFRKALWVDATARRLAGPPHGCTQTASADAILIPPLNSTRSDVLPMMAGPPASTYSNGRRKVVTRLVTGGPGVAVAPAERTVPGVPPGVATAGSEAATGTSLSTGAPAAPG